MKITVSTLWGTTKSNAQITSDDSGEFGVVAADDGDWLQTSCELWRSDLGVNLATQYIHYLHVAYMAVYKSSTITIYIINSRKG